MDFAQTTTAGVSPARAKTDPTCHKQRVFKVQKNKPNAHPAQRQVLAAAAGGGFGGKKLKGRKRPTGLNPFGRGKAPARPPARNVSRLLA